MTYVYILSMILSTAGALYLVIKSVDARKFLAGAFFVSGGFLYYLSLAKVSVPILGTTFIHTPELAGRRCIVHFIFFALCFYFGFVKKTAPKPA